jgi:hypothetical protein
MTIHFLLVMAGTFAAAVEAIPNAVLLRTGTRNHSGWLLTTAYATFNLENVLNPLAFFAYFDGNL